MQQRVSGKAALALFGALALVADPAAAAPRALGTVKTLRMLQEGAKTVLTIVGTGTPTFTVFKLERPTRVVVDVANAELDAGADGSGLNSTWAVGSVQATQMRDDQATTSRVVITLRRPGDYDVKAQGSDIVVTVTSAEAPASEPQPLARKADAEVRKELEAARAEAQRANAEADRLRKQLEQQKQSADQALTQALARKAEADQAARRADERRVEAEKAPQAAEKGAASKAEIAQARAELDKAKAEAAVRRLAAEDAAKTAQVRANDADTAKREIERLRGEVERLQAAQASAKTARRSEEEARATEARAKAEHAQKEAERASAKLEATRKEASEATRLAVEERKREESRTQSSRQEAAQAEVRRREVEAKIAAAEAATRIEEARARSAREARQREETAAREAGDARKREESAAKDAVAARKLFVERQREAQLALGAIEKKKQAAEAAQRAADSRRKEADAAQARAEAMRKDKRQKDEIAAAAAEAHEREEAQRRAEAFAQRLSGELAQARTAVERSQTAEREATQAQSRAEDRRKESERDVARLDEARRRAQIEAQGAETERQRAQSEAQRIRKDVDAAMSARQDEERRRREAESARFTEEQRLALALGARRAEEQKLQSVRAELARLEEKRKTEAQAASANANANANANAKPDPSVPGARSRLQRVAFVDEPTRSSVILDLAGAMTSYEVERSRPNTVVLSIKGAQLSEDAPRTLDATEFLGPVRLIQTRQDSRTGIVKVTVELVEKVRDNVRQVGSRLYWDFAKAGAGPRGEASISEFRAPAFANFVAAAPVSSNISDLSNRSSKKRYTGRRIDLDFKDADIHNILRLLQDVGQINIITTDDVRGSVTLRMKNVPWDQALDVVLRSKALGMVREGNIIRVAPLITLEKELEQEIARQKQRIEVEPLETRLIPLSYAQGGDIDRQIRDLMSSRGRVLMDGRTNTLVVSDVARNIELVEELVRSLDTQTAQVLIEARIVEARANFARDVGIQWGFGYLASVASGNPTGLVFPSTVGVAGGATDGAAPLGGLLGTGAQSPNFAVSLPAPAGTGAGGAIGLTLGSLSGNFNMALRLSALENTGQIRIVSSPKIQTMDNVAATITQGVGIPISQVSAAGVNTTFVDASMVLSVTPKVTNEGTVVLRLSVSRNEPDFANTGARGDPTILRKQANTTLLVKDGDTAVLGGVYVRNTGWSVKKVPWLAEIPVLGWFFRDRREEDERSEMLIFITPRILNRARSIGQ